MDHAAPRPLEGIAWMVATGVCFVAVTVVVKFSAQDLPAAQAGFLRYLLGLVFLLPVARTLLSARLVRRDWVLFGARGTVHALGVALWFYAMTRLPIAEVTAMNYLAPVYVTLGAALFLGERLALRRVLAIAAALLGAFVILRPGFREVSAAHGAMVLTAMFFGASYLLTKRLSDDHGAPMIVAMLSITVTIALAPLAALDWVRPTPVDLAWMFLVAVFATAGHYAMARAFRVAPVMVTQPVTFLQLVWAVLLGWAIFAEPPDVWVVLGGAIILSAVSFIAWREAVAKRRAVSPPPPDP
ncbi:DMT family transporter [Jannaschia sp. LMIT008]|uniref:DMT family transporter n=1 Tax=Jannaschia maritima TaxID=3032585 RepID=UPI00281232F6|nr:DMT family transporter [Jannaschia sp. LMIT008]